MSCRSELKHPLRIFVPLCAITFLLLTSFDRVAVAAEKPNIVLLFIDDWAWNGTPVPMNDGMENSRNRDLYFHYPHHRTTTPHSAVVSGSRKLLHFYERPDLPMLLDLAADTGEVHNIAQAHPEEHRRLYDEMMGYFGRVGARIPKLNPNYDAAAYRNSKEYNKRVLWGPFIGRRPLEEDEK